MFINVLYVPSLAANLLFVYQMTHNGAPKRVVFGPDSMEITDIATRNIIVNGIANNASKAYEFSHFLPYSAPTQFKKSFERGGINSLTYPFADNGMLSNFSFRR